MVTLLTHRLVALVEEFSGAIEIRFFFLIRLMANHVMLVAVDSSISRLELLWLLWQESKYNLWLFLLLKK